MSKALLNAAASGNIAKLDSLLASGAEIDFADKATGRTALIEAAIAGHADAARWLIDNAAGLDRTDRILGYTALGWAANEGHAQIVESLLAAQAAVDLTRCEFQRTPLMLAAREGHQALVLALLAAGADVHAQSGDACNALAMAEARGHAGVVEALKQHGARPPAPAVETSIPWPAVSPDLSDVDDADPASVLRGFLLAMHRWETDSYNQQMSLGEDEDLDWSVVQHAQNLIFERFCTPKPRKYGRLGSFGFPPTYTADDALLRIEPQARRSALLTRQPASAPLRYEVMFSLVNKGGVWRVDSKKTRPVGSSAKWTVGIL